MRAPGGAWLEWRIEPLDPGRARLHQRAIFFPKGLAGRVYWYALVPFHGIIFKGMLENIAGAAHRAARDPARTPSAGDPMSHPVDSIDAM
ncbi:MAG: DUF2867 domain-containing protein, partial [Acidobacteria bacterium]